MAKPVDHATSNRLAEAALLLLDAAREGAKSAPDYRPGHPNVATTLALAVQSLIIADHMPAGGASDEQHPIPPEFVHRWRGVAAGLGVSIGAMNNPGPVAIAVAMCAESMGRAAQECVSAGRATK